MKKETLPPPSGCPQHGSPIPVLPEHSKKLSAMIREAAGVELDADACKRIAYLVRRAHAQGMRNCKDFGAPLPANAAGAPAIGPCDVSGVPVALAPKAIRILLLISRAQPLRRISNCTAHLRTLASLGYIFRKRPKDRYRITDEGRDVAPHYARIYESYKEGTLYSDGAHMSDSYVSAFGPK